MLGSKSGALGKVPRSGFSGGDHKRHNQVMASRSSGPRVFQFPFPEPAGVSDIIEGLKPSLINS